MQQLGSPYLTYLCQNYRLGKCGDESVDRKTKCHINAAGKLGLLNVVQVPATVLLWLLSLAFKAENLALNEILWFQRWKLNQIWKSEEDN